MTGNDKIVAFPDLGEIETQAAEWIVRLDEGDLSPDGLAAFHAWRSAHDLHRETFERLCRLWGQMEILEELVDYAAADDNVKSLVKETGYYGRGLNRRALLAGSVALVAAISGGVAYKVIQANGGTYQNIFDTTIGEQKKVMLPDGSAVDLNTNSSIRVEYVGNARGIWLLRGEAHFDVASDTARPFSVYASDGVVTAVGTAFSVRLHDEEGSEDIEVTVAEGRVSLSALEHSSSTSLLSDRDLTPTAPRKLLTEVKAGQNAVFHNSVEWVKDIEFAALERKLSWREGLLSFSGESLSEVLDDIGRYTDVTIEITDDDLKNLPVAGYFKIGNLDAMLEALEIMADIRVDRVNPKLVRLYRARQA